MKSIRISLCVLAAFAVFAHGAVEAWSQGILEIGAAILLVWWGVLFASGRIREWRWNWLLLPLSAFLAVALWQYFAGKTELAFVTRIEMLWFAALAILYFLAVQAFRTVEEWYGFTWFLLVLAFAVSVLGILQHFTFNGKLYWVREMRYGGIPFGPYVNRNHFAGLIELIVPLGLSLLLLRAEGRGRTPLLALLMLVPVGALFLSASRGGIAGLAIEAALVTALTLARGTRIRLVAAGGVAMLAGAFVVWLGAGHALERFETYRRLEVSEKRRTEIITDSWHIFTDHALAGTGVGTLEVAFPRYETIYDGTVVQHSHNDYVEGLAETGLIGGIVGLLFVGLFLTRSWESLKRAATPLSLALRIGALSACVGLMTHSLVDFNLHIPSNALVFLLDCALATSVLTPEPRPIVPAKN